MQGKILTYSIQESSGIISAKDGKRYSFSNSDWKSEKSPNKDQLVDFVVDDKKATEIYLETSRLSFDVDEIKSKVFNDKNSKYFTNILSQKVQNKFGFILSLITAIALFFPIIKIPLYGNGSLIDGGMGKILFILLLLTSFFFYSGIKRIFVKATITVIALIAFFQFYDLFSGLSSADDLMSALSGSHSSFMNMVSFGTPLLILLIIFLVYAGFKRTYTEIK